MHVQDLLVVRYIDRYRKEDGRWRFAKRVVTYDMRSTHPIPAPIGDAPNPAEDPSYTTLASRLFARGPRACLAFWREGDGAIAGWPH